MSLHISLYQADVVHKLSRVVLEEEGHLGTGINQKGIYTTTYSQIEI